ncbi:PREDICTED: putative clathrin assembly protein At4g40080 [Fragaria vesca subsp. vesca]|uniref:putative clathrin assembly protein At4g40080 n=1 Tax=Fragaria vesca subsp. vesca TaxID=101020 RepID=UPI0002C2DDDF|nr:PREDICTED: putative clathrin assembly protein At4g40080 [Fragaria vesca subsp. vesca]
MGRQTKLKDLLMGAIKDKASQSKAAILSKLNTDACSPLSSQSLHLTLLRATTHDPFSPPPAKHLATLLSFGHSSRATASAAIEALMDRLQTTQNSSVALKCLIAVHHIVKYGSFILQDQLSVFPSAGGRNYLKLSNFRDNSSPISWDLSSWVRWYGQYVENLIITSRYLGFFLGSNSCIADRDRQEERISALMNTDLVRETESLVSLMEEICRRPESLNGNRLVGEILGLVGQDQIATVNEVSVRVNEFGERLSCMSFGDSVELLSALKRSEDCKERLVTVSSAVKSDLVERFWELMREMKGRVGNEKEIKEGGKLVVMAVRRDSVGESARFGDRVLKSSDSVRFSSGRLKVRFNLPMESCA